MQESVNKDREKYIGGSDIPIIMNLSPFKTRFDLLLEKAGYKEDEFKGNVFTEYGNTLEPVIRDFINADRPQKFMEGKHVREAAPDELIGARIHTDGETENEILEIKTTGEIFESVYDYKIYLVQMLYYMLLTGKPYGLLAVYERPKDLSTEFDPERLHIYKVDIEEESGLVKEIVDAVEKFIEDLAKVKANPFITEAELLPAEIPDIASRILAFESQIEYFKRIEKTIKSEKERLKKAMDAAGVPSWKTPNGYIITRVKDGDDKTEAVEKLDEEALKRDLPELFKPESEGGYLKTETKTTKGKAGYVLITAPKKKGGDNGSQ